jgi:hypothetical protein
VLDEAAHVDQGVGALAHMGHPGDDLAHEGRQALARPLGRLCGCHDRHPRLPDTMTADADTVRAGENATSTLLAKSF